MNFKSIGLIHFILFVLLESIVKTDYSLCGDLEIF